MYTNIQKKCGVLSTGTTDKTRKPTLRLIKRLLEDRRNLLLILKYVGRKSPTLFLKVLEEINDEMNQSEIQN